MENKAFILITFVLVIYAIVILAGLALCIYNSANGANQCDADNRLQKLLEQMLTFVAGYAARNLTEDKK